MTRDNAGINGVPLGRGGGRLALAVAPGTDHPAIRHRAPYDLVVANILAGPLITLAPDIASATAPGGHAILAGLILNTFGIHRAYIYIGLLVMLYALLAIYAIIATPETKNVDLEG